jgi:uncharacterized OB-fold protein
LAEHEWMNDIRPLVGKEYGRVYAWDKINAPMIRQWCEAMGMDDSAYTAEGAVVAPPAMLQVWCMEGLTANNYPPGSTTENPYEVLRLFEAQGFPAVVAVNSELTFGRDLREGERLYYTTRLDAISPEKTTALGTGYFVTLIMTYFSEQPQGDDEQVGQLLFRVFKFRPANAGAPAKAEAPAKAKAPAKRPLPGISDDTRFFWDGARAGQLLIQRCKSCGTLRHPPGPVCPECHSFEWDTLQSSGRGTVYSFVVMHYPEVPPFDHPNPIALIELEEGTRLISQLVGVAPGDVRIGQAVQVEFNTFNDGELVLPQFRPVLDAQGAPA